MQSKINTNIVTDKTKNTSVVVRKEINETRINITNRALIIFMSNIIY